ncbi:MAG TPA: hypothetical protein PKA20_15475 [Burkholderiaceae bacterium]|nr:hypothetical protein [Burkholderiaceae bacterium]
MFNGCANGGANDTGMLPDRKGRHGRTGGARHAGGRSRLSGAHRPICPALPLLFAASPALVRGRISTSLAVYLGCAVRIELFEVDPAAAPINAPKRPVRVFDSSALPCIGARVVLEGKTWWVHGVTIDYDLGNVVVSVRSRR